MPVNGNNDKQFHSKLINVVRPVFLILLSFIFDNRQGTTAVTFSTLNPRYLSFCPLNNRCIAFVPVDRLLFSPMFSFCLYTVKAVELDEDRERALICFQCFNIRGQYFQPSHGPLSFHLMTAEHCAKVCKFYTCRLLLALRLNSR